MSSSRKYFAPFVGYKQCWGPDYDREHEDSPDTYFLRRRVIVTLEIVGQSNVNCENKQTNIPQSFRKFRCDRARVLSIRDFDDVEFSEALSQYDLDFRYPVGEIVSVPDYEPDGQCACGIHFYLSKAAACGHNMPLFSCVFADFTGDVFYNRCNYSKSFPRNRRYALMKYENGVIVDQVEFV